jgi:hypothetical protein
MNVKLILVAQLVCAGALQGQSAPPEIGRYPVLDSLPRSGSCQSAPMTPEMRSGGVTKLVALNDRTTDRMISLGVDQKNRPVMLIAFASKRFGERSQTERATILFDSTGRVLRGDRHYSTTGTPASSAEDRKWGLLAVDSTRARTLASSLLVRCGR